MKRFLCILALLLGTTWCAVADGGFSLSLSAGTTIRGGVVALGGVAYAPFDDVALSLSSGYMTWIYSKPGPYDTRLVPIAFSVRYYLSHGLFRPYVSGELEYILGEFDMTDLPYAQQILYGPKKVSELGSGLGLGVQLPLAERLDLDMGSVILLTAINSTVYHLRFTAGVSFNL